MATRNLIPRGSGEGGLGIETTPWGTAFFNSGNFVSGITVSGNPVPTGFDIGGGGGAVIEGDDDNINFGGTDPADTRDINFMQGGENVMIINEEGNVNIENNMSVSGTISGVSGIFDERVGIGTTSPGAKLDIVNTSSTTTESYGLSVQGGGNSTGGGYSLRALDKDGNVDFFVRGDGNVGIGTSNPGHNLDIVGSNATVRTFENGGADIRITSGASTGYIGTHTAHELRLLTGGTPRITMDSVGNVGIGTTSPGSSYKLDVRGAVHLGNLTSSVLTHVIRSGGGITNSLANGLRLVPGSAQTTNQYISFHNGTNSQVHIASLGSVADDFLIRTREKASAFFIKQNGNVGIGTPTPGAKLEIKSGVNAFPITDISADQATSLRVRGNDNAVIDMGTNGGDGTWIQARNKVTDNIQYNLSLNPLGGNVGIGTTVTDEKLTIFDNIKPVIRLVGNGNNVAGTNFGEIQFYNSDNSGDGPNVAASIHAQSTSVTGSGGSLVFSTEDSVADGEGRSADPRMVIDQEGNVGIGLPNPQVKLEVNGGVDNSVVFRGRCDSDPSHTGSGAGNNGRFNLVAFSSDAGNDYGGGIKIQTRDGANAFHDRMTIDEGGNVGIGTENPAIARLDIEEPATTNLTTGLFVRNKSSHASSVIAGFHHNSDYVMQIKTNGRVGIGTTNPNNPLHVNENVNGASQTVLFSNFDNTAGTSQTVQLNLGLARNSGSQKTAFRISCGKEQDWTNDDTKLDSYAAFSTLENGLLHERMRIDSSGRVGIGTTVPAGPFHVYSTNASQINLTRALDIRGSAGGASAEIHGGALVSTTPTMGGTIGFTLKDSDGSGSGTNTEGLVYFKVKDSGGNLTEKMRIDSDGKVGIGATSPVFALDVQNQTSITLGADTNNVRPTNKVKSSRVGGVHYDNSKSPVNMMMHYCNATENNLYFGWGTSAMVCPTKIVFGTASNNNISSANSSSLQRMVIDGSGQVGIGTTAPEQKLFLKDGHFGMDGSGYIIQRGTANTTGEYGIIHRTGYYSGAQNTHFGRVRINTSYNASTNAADLRFYTAPGGGGSSRLAFVIGSSGTVRCEYDLEVTGNVSKGSGTFKIDHPLPEKSETHHLVHSFIEGPQADNIYRGKVELVAGKAEVNIDAVSGMTEGTFVALNRDIQAFTSNESDWDAVRGKVEGNKVIIECQNAESTATVSWLVIGERQDEHMLKSKTTDENGKLIVEPLKPEPEPEYEMVDSDEVVTEEPAAEEAPVEEPASEEVTEEVVEEPVAEEVSEESSEAVSLGASISSTNLDEIKDLRAEESSEN